MRYALLALLIAGCAAGKPWTHPEGKDAAQAERECDYEAARATAGIVNSFNAGFERGSLRVQCMEVRGFRR